MEQIIYTEKTDGISIDRIRRDAAFSMPRKHLHNEYEIYYLLEGERYYFIDRRTCHVTGEAWCSLTEIPDSPDQPGRSLHERILISLDPSPFSEFLSSTGRCHCRASFPPVILVYLPWIGRTGSGWSACWTIRLRNFMKKRLDLGIWPCQICPAFHILAQRHMSGSSSSPPSPVYPAQTQKGR